MAWAVSRTAGQGGLSVLPIWRTQLLAAAAGAWLALQFSLVFWWATLIERQARRIAELEGLGGTGGLEASRQWSRTRLMLVGESSTFFVLLLAISLLLAWLYWREHQRARSMQAFFAGVTHELRTPLTSMRLQAEAIAEGDQRAELAVRLLEDSHRLESQIDKTLELARIEGGGPLSEQAIPLQSWVPRTLAWVAQAHRERVQLHAQIDAAVPPILADAGALQLILRNLVENSVRHAHVCPVGVEVSASVHGQRVLLACQDNGQGLATGSGRLGRLFGRGPQSSGAGVGLYLVRRLMQRMGGRARFDTAPGKGFRTELAFRVAE
jgi:signal transduction histidine kinase